MNDDVYTKKLIDALYTTVCDSVPAGSRDDCPVFQAIRDLHDTQNQNF